MSVLIDVQSEKCPPLLIIGPRFEEPIVVASLIDRRVWESNTKFYVLLMKKFNVCSINPKILTFFNVSIQEFRINLGQSAILTMNFILCDKEATRRSKQNIWEKNKKLCSS